MVAVSRLSPDAKARIKRLSGPKPARYLLELAMTWMVIAITAYVAVLCQNVFVSLVAIYIIATRQNLLALLIHEQTHYLGLRSKFGDSIVNCLASYPLMAVTVEGYAKIHLAHHRFYFTSQDPDFGRKQGGDWTFPMRKSRLLHLMLQDMLGVSFLKYVLTRQKSLVRSPFKRRNPSPKFLRPVFFVSLTVILFATHGWFYLLVYWLIPLVTIFPVIVRWSAICEHSYGYEGSTVEETSPVILPSLLSKVFLPNLNFTMHAYHHYFPGVSFSALPQVHDIFVAENLVREDQVFCGHIDYLRYIITGQRVASSELGESERSIAT